MLGDYGWSCGSWSLYSATGNIPIALSEAIIATYMTIHMARSPVHTVGELRLLAGVPGGSGKSYGCGFQATKSRVRFVRRVYPPCQRRHAHPCANTADFSEGLAALGALEALPGAP